MPVLNAPRNCAADNPLSAVPCTMNLFAKATLADPSTLFPAKLRAVCHLGADTIVITGVVVEFATVAFPSAEVTAVTPVPVGTAHPPSPVQNVLDTADVPLFERVTDGFHVTHVCKG